MQPDILTAAQWAHWFTTIARGSEGVFTAENKLRAHDAALRVELENTRQALRELHEAVFRRDITLVNWAMLRDDGYDALGDEG